jgi:FHA domain/Trypsin-like peptidase domain
MKAQLNILSGTPSAGSVFVFSEAEIILGRHPDCDLQFDPEQDLEVSARHASIERQGDHWVVKDLGSTNGTLVNGHAITGPTRLSNTDHVRLGKTGPVLEFSRVSDEAEDTSKRHVIRKTPRATADAGQTAHRVRVEVAKHTRRLRITLAAVSGALVVVVAIASFFVWRQEQIREREVAQLQAAIDSVLSTADSTVGELQGRVAGLVSALQQSQVEVRDLQSQLTEARRLGNEEQVTALSRRLTETMAALSRQQDAARIDHARIRAANQRAVAMIWVEYAPGDVATGTAFAVRADAVMVTNRHVVAGDDGTREPRRIGVQFADSDQVFRAHVVAISNDPGVDLALVKVDLTGEVPIVQGINPRPDTIPAGAPVAIIGFPLGTDLPMRVGRSGRIATTTLTAGIVSKSLPNDMQIHGYGAAGASGSPIFDANGQVISVLYGGQTGGADQLLFAVPSNFVTRLLQQVR